MKNRVLLIIATLVCSCAPATADSTTYESYYLSSSVSSDEPSKAEDVFNKYVFEEKTFFGFEVCSTEAILSKGRNRFSDIYFDFIKDDCCYDVSSGDESDDFDLFESHVAVSGGPTQEGHYLEKVNKSSQVFVTLLKSAAYSPREIYIDVVSYLKTDLTQISGFASLVVYPDSTYEKVDFDDDYGSGYMRWKLDLVFSYFFPEIEGSHQSIKKDDIDYSFKEMHKKTAGTFYKTV